MHRVHNKHYSDVSILTLESEAASIPLTNTRSPSNNATDRLT